MTSCGIVAAGFALLAGVFSGTAVVGAAPRFTAPVFAPSDAEKIAAADVDGDGNPDLVTAGLIRDRTSVLLGNGDGTFARPVIYSTGVGRPSADLLAVDVTADGAPDLISAISTDFNEGSVFVWRNDGAGRFGRAQRYAAGNHVNALVSGDLNHDGIVDLLTAQPASRPAGGVTDANEPALSVLLGTGAGRFGAAQRVPGGGAAEVGVADFNSDGRLDVVLSSNRSKRVALRLGNGDGTFTPARAFGPRGGGYGFELATADLNHDGKLDLAATGVLRGVVYRFLGNGDGTFGAASVYPMARYPISMVIADLDGDGNAEIAVIDYDGRIVVRSGRSDGTFGNRHVLPWDTTNELIVADVNRDGRPDLVANGETARGDRGVMIMLNWTDRRRLPCVAVPVEHMRVRVARRHIERAGCRLARVRYRYSRNVDESRVIRQRPRYGAVLPSHAPIHLLVSRGPRR